MEYKEIREQIKRELDLEQREKAIAEKEKAIKESEEKEKAIERNKENESFTFNFTGVRPKR